MGTLDDYFATNEVGDIQYYPGPHQVSAVPPYSGQQQRQQEVEGRQSSRDGDGRMETLQRRR